MSHVLLIDDDIELVGMFRDYLENEDFLVSVAHNGEAGVREVLSAKYAIAILDVMMPRLNGLETLRRIRVRSNLPVLMLTGRGDDADRILGLELGADDYVAKPCTPRELTARIRAILRRTNSGAREGTPITLSVGKLAILPEQRLASWDGKPLELTSTEFNLLEVLARNAGRPVSKNELSELGLGRPMARFDRNIDVHLSSLRRKPAGRPLLPADRVPAWLPADSRVAHGTPVLENLPGNPARPAHRRGRPGYRILAQRPVAPAGATDHRRQPLRQVHA